MSDPHGTSDGVQFPVVNGKRSSQRAGKQLFAAAVRGANPALAQEIEGTDEWRKNYLGPVRKIVELGAASAAVATQVAADGLRAERDTLVFERNGATRGLHEAFDDPDPAGLSTSTVEGTGSRSGALELPLGKDRLAGDALRRQLDRWVDEGTIESSCAEAVKLVVANPDWMDLSDVNVAVLGAASEMGPMRALCKWGATVHAIDLPRPQLWDSILQIAREGTGRVHYPTVTNNGGDEGQTAGVDLLRSGPEVRAWLSSFGVPLVVGDYTYADGTTFVQLSAAVDAVIEGLRRDDRLQATAYLATPTDVFAVHGSTATETASKRSSGPVRSIGRAASFGRLYSPNYQTLIADTDGRQWGISDCLVAQQGANYALAKNLQRWRSIDLRKNGVVTSANVAPPTRTRSVTKNKILAAAYNGCSRFGVTVFDPPTSRTLMGALLVHDLRNPKAVSHPENTLAHPYDLLCDGAAHGGIWRLPHEPRSILPLAVLVGLGKRRS